MFDKTRYVIERKRLALRDIYGVKDVSGNLLGYVKKEKLRSNFWFEGTDGTRLGEVREVSRRKILLDRYEVYDAQNRLRAIIKPKEWRIEDSEGRKLAMAKQSSKFFAEYQILAPDGGVIAQIRKKRGLAAFRDSYSIDISRQGFNPFLILSYAVLMAYRHREATSGWG